MLAVPKDDITFIDVNRTLVIARPSRAHRRRILLLLLGQLPQSFSIAIDDVCVEVFLDWIGVQLPMKVNVLTIRRPAHIARVPAGETVAAHDVIDRELRARGDGEREEKDERNSLHGAE